MANPISETNNGLNTVLDNDPQELADDELETVAGGLLPGAGAVGDSAVCVNS